MWILWVSYAVHILLLDYISQGDIYFITLYFPTVVITCRLKCHTINHITSLWNNICWWKLNHWFPNVLIMTSFYKCLLGESCHFSDVSSLTKKEKFFSWSVRAIGGNHRQIQYIIFWYVAHGNEDIMIIMNQIHQICKTTYIARQ